VKLLSPALSRLARLRFWKIESWTNTPIDTQREVFQDIITHGQYTQFGKKHNFESIHNIAQFKNLVPIQEYDEVKHYVDLMMQNQDNILWNTPTKWFAKSSGTTAAKSKFIPVTKESLEDCHFQGTKDVLSLYYQQNPTSDLLTGKALVVGGSHQISITNNDIQFGDLSAILLQNAPYWGQWLRTPELSIALLDEWEHKIEQLAINTINENVTSISGVPTWTLVLLKRILQITGKKNIAEVWPNLELYIHGGVSFIPYKNQFAQIIGRPIHYLEIYNASEGFFAAQNNFNNDGMLLFLNHGIFYEFMPVEEYQKTNPITVDLENVVVNKNYAMVISTNSGLWRYMLGDTILFTSIYPFKIKVTGRLKHFINAFGEELIVDNADAAIAIAAEKTNAIVANYTAAPHYFSNSSNGTHQWLIEFEKLPLHLEEFTMQLDKELQNQNSDYEAKRYKDIALKMPIINSVAVGTFNKWLATNNKLGGQHKVPRLCNDRNIIDEILKLL
jgi:GH3 auxin-responsive promoter